MKTNNDLTINFDNENEEEIIYVSKSEIKRDAQVIRDLGVELVNLNKTNLDKLALDEDLLDAILLAKRIKKEGYRRQIQLIGKMLRNRDTAPIYDALDRLKNRFNQDIVAKRQLEKLRDDLISTLDTQLIIDIYPQADRQQLRTLARLAKKENNALSKSSLLIIKYLKQLSEI